jgi:hypothetical protein
MAFSALPGSLIVMAALNWVTSDWLSLSVT